MAKFKSYRDLPTYRPMAKFQPTTKQTLDLVFDSTSVSIVDGDGSFHRKD